MQMKWFDYLIGHSTRYYFKLLRNAMNHPDGQPIELSVAEQGTQHSKAVRTVMNIRVKCCSLKFETDQTRDMSCLSCVCFCVPVAWKRKHKHILYLRS